MLSFYVSEKYYEISRENIENFPVETFLLGLIKHQGFHMDKKDEAIILKTPFKYFNYVVKIYNNPSLKLSEILKDEFQELMTLFEKFDETTGYDDLHDWLCFRDESLLFQLKENIFDDSNYKIFIKELKYLGIFEHFKNDVSFEQDLNFPDFLAEKVLNIGGFFSGSYLLNLLTKDSWKSSDIDIYVHENMLQSRFFDGRKSDRIDCNAVVKYFNGTGMEIITRNSPKYNPHYESYCSCLGNCSQNLTFILKFKVEDICIDLICVRIPVPIFISKNFDFSFLKMYSDGINLHVFDKKALRTRKATFNCVCFNTMKKRQRIQKYHDRGYIVTFNFQHKGGVFSREKKDNEMTFEEFLGK